MPREAQIPLFLWIATAVLVHLLGGGGALEAATWVEDQNDLRRFAQGVRSYLSLQHDTVEIALLTSAPEEPEPEPDASEDEATPPDLPPEPDPEAGREPDDEAQDDAETDAERKREEEREQERKLQEEELKVKVEEEKPPEKSLTPQELVVEKRIAVRQHVEDENQPDNEDAEFIGDQANHVLEQTRARITSNAQNDPDPSPGTNLSGVGELPGDAHETRIAQDEDRPGAEAKAPSDDPAQKHADTRQPPPNAGATGASADLHASPSRKGSLNGTEAVPQGRTGEEPTPGSRAQPEIAAQHSAPELVTSPEDSDAVEGARPEIQGRQARRAEPRRELPRRRLRGLDQLLGYGATGTTENGINLNLTPGLATQAIGLDRLSRDRRADSARRRSQHLGSWKTAGLERWRSAIENYTSEVKPGNQTALNTARVPFATYLALIHNRLHPIFADWFLSSLNRLPSSHPMNRPNLSTNLEVVLDRDEGRVVKMGVTKASGVTAFDIGALESVQRAQPFGAPPSSIVSPDGRVYLHWEFHREPWYACSTYFARPYLLKVSPQPAPVPEDHPDDQVPEELQRERGALDPSRPGPRP